MKKYLLIALTACLFGLHAPQTIASERDEDAASSNTVLIEFNLYLQEFDQLQFHSSLAEEISMDIANVYVANDWMHNDWQFQMSANIMSFMDNYSEIAPFRLTPTSYVIENSITIGGTTDHGYTVVIIGLPVQ